MNKGYVPQRTPYAHQVAANINKSFKGIYIYVEGEIDCCFWRNFVDGTNVKLIACNGWKQVVDTVTSRPVNDIKCIGIVDRDFHDYVVQEDKNKENIFITDDHDLEMMIFHSGDYKKMINSFDPSDNVGNYDNNHQTHMFEEVCKIADSIAKLKLVSCKDNINIKFSYYNKKTDKKEYPDYEKVINTENFSVVNDNAFVNYFIEWSKNKGQSINVSNENVLEKYLIERDVEYDKWHLLNGHDVTELLFLFMKKKLRIKMLKFNNSSDMERNLIASYEYEHLRGTTLYNKMINYANSNDIQIFKPR